MRLMDIANNVLCITDGRLRIDAHLAASGREYPNPNLGSKDRSGRPAVPGLAVIMGACRWHSAPVRGSAAEQLPGLVDMLKVARRNRR